MIYISFIYLCQLKLSDIMNNQYNIDKILARHGEKKLKSYYNKNILKLLPGITDFNVELINIYFDDTKKLDIIRIYFNKVKKLNALKNACGTNNKLINNIINCSKWLKYILCDDLIKYKILNKWFDFILKNKNILSCKIYNEKIIINPMCLTNIEMTFPKIDIIALKNKWWLVDSDIRYYNVINYIINEYCMRTGNTLFCINDIYKIYCNNEIKYNLTKPLLKKQFGALLLDGMIIKINHEYMLYKYFLISYKISEFTNLLLNDKIEEKSYAIDDPDITKEQLLAINGIMKSRISILSGKGGTGKTSMVIKNICKYVAKNTLKKVLFLAPTHAAKNNGINIIGKFCRFKFSTIAAFVYGEMLDIENTLYIFIDEMSMVGIEDFYKILNIINCGESLHDIHLVLIGDYNQLEPISIGCPLKDIIELIPTFKLSKNFRSLQTDIPLFCDIILGESEHKKYWSLSKDYINDMKNIYIDTNSNYEPKLVAILRKLKKNGYVPNSNNNEITDNIFQVITLTNKTCINISKIVRNEFSDIYCESNKIFEICDPIIMKKNIPLFKNGDLAEIIDIDYVSDYYNMYTIKLQNKISDENIKSFYEKKSEYNIEYDEFENTIKLQSEYFKPCFAITVHGSQGLGFDVVIYVIDNYIGMVSMNLNYTAYSRAKKDLYLIGNKMGFNGIKARKKSNRNTLLHKITKNIDNYKKYYKN